MRTLTAKLIDSHSVESPGEGLLALSLDQVLIEDATGTMAGLQFEPLGVQRSAVPLALCGQKARRAQHQLHRLDSRDHRRRPGRDQRDDHGDRAGRQAGARGWELMSSTVDVLEESINATGQQKIAAEQVSGAMVEVRSAAEQIAAEQRERAGSAERVGQLVDDLEQRLAQLSAVGGGNDAAHTNGQPPARASAAARSKSP